MYFWNVNHITHFDFKFEWCASIRILRTLRDFRWSNWGFPLKLRLHDDVIKWKHFSALLAICAGNSPVPGEFPTQRPVTRSFDVFFDLRPNKRLSKQWWGWWFETQSCPLWRHYNGEASYYDKMYAMLLTSTINTVMVNMKSSMMQKVDIYTWLTNTNLHLKLFSSISSMLRSRLLKNDTT